MHRQEKFPAFHFLFPLILVSSHAALFTSWLCFSHVYPSRSFFCSGTRDRRFQPISAGEIPSLECKVSLLKCYEPADDYLDWEVGVHGLTIEFDDDSR